jgi:hypothetical protein
MMIELINRFLIITLILSGLNIIRHVYYFNQAILSANDEEPVVYKLKPISLMLLGLSIAYIISIFFTGIKI